ncbi:hypothetical protein BB029_06345 [Pseudomonas sp. S3E12]|nr:hypothetical protein BB029_06345 [Pseudomonas sp. S3E12]
MLTQRQHLARQAVLLELACAGGIVMADQLPALVVIGKVFLGARILVALRAALFEYRRRSQPLIVLNQLHTAPCIPGLYQLASLSEQRNAPTRIDTLGSQGRVV